MSKEGLMKMRVLFALARPILLGSVLTLPIGSEPAMDQVRIEKFLSDLHHTNQLEIQMGKIAKEHGASDSVRSFGEQLIKDHAEADEKVERLAEQKKMALIEPRPGLVARLSASNENSLMSELIKEKGRFFDQDFAKAIANDHARELSKLKSARESLHQPDVQALISDLLPTMVRHLRIAERLQQNS
jgi:putative membrane protein